MICLALAPISTAWPIDIGHSKLLSNASRGSAGPVNCPSDWLQAPSRPPSRGPEDDEAAAIEAQIKREELELVALRDAQASLEHDVRLSTAI